MRWDAKTLHGRLLRLPLRLLPTDQVLPVLSGPLKGLRWVSGSAPHGAWFGTLERAKLQIFEASLRPGEVVYDLGANVGLYTLCASRAVGREGRVYAFEPIPRNQRALIRHVALNSLDNVVLVERAVSDRDTLVRMAAGDSPSEWSVRPIGEHEVRAVALDSWREGNRAPGPQAIKIDVEGSETAVLVGARRTLESHHPKIFLALHGDDQRRSCRELLEGMGYRIRKWEPADPDEEASEWYAEFPE